MKIISPGQLYDASQFKPTIILLLSALLPTIHIYFGSIRFATQQFASINSFYAATYMFLSMFILMGMIPFFIIRFVFNESLRDYGVAIGDWRRGLPTVLLLGLIIAGLLLLPSSRNADFRQVYPLDRSAGESAIALLRLEVLRGVFFYSAWEFFFRGFMIFGLRQYVGDWLAICIQTIPSCLWHIGLPPGEILASIVAGILFGIIVIRTRSILWVFILHFFIGAILDLFIVIT